MVVRGLSDRQARRPLGGLISGSVDQRVIHRILDETHGNRLALTEPPSDLTPVQLAGGFGLPAASALDQRVQEAFRRRLVTLPEATRMLLRPCILR